MKHELISNMNKLAIIVSHPIQYYAPWFRYLTDAIDLDVKVFYLWNFGVTQQIDQGFKQAFEWDIPLLEGYNYEFIPNVSSSPGTHHFRGLKNPALFSKVGLYDPNAILLMNYNYASIYQFLWQWQNHKSPIVFRGDSHRLIPNTGVKSWARRQFISQLYRRFAACLYVGKANYEYFRHHHVAPKQLFFSPHTVDNDRFFTQATLAIQEATLWKRELGIPDDYAVILFAGKFEEKKRPFDLLRAFVQANLSKVCLLFVGSGTLEQALKTEARKHANIFFASFQNQSLMSRTYAAADLFVLPSYGGWETWGLSINEAMCLGCPVLTSTHVGCTQDLVYPYKNGLSFPAGDVDALTQALKEAFIDRHRLKQWGLESRRIVSQYSYAQATGGLNQALDYVLHSSNLAG